MRDQPPPALIRRMRHVHWLALDWLLAAVVLVPSVGHAAGQRAQFGLPVWLTVTAAGATAAVVAVRRVWPVAVFAVVLVLNTFVTAVGASGNPAVIVAIALYAVAVSRPPGRSLAALAAALVPTTGAELYSGLAGRPPLASEALQDLVVATSLIASAAWATAAAVREQRRYVVRAAEQLAERAVTDERLRIARELHDVIAHSMTLITAKAAVTNYLIDSRPEEVRSALELIEATGHGALTELRRMLGVLRTDAAGATGVRVPAPGLSGLPELAAAATAAGVRTHLQVRGDRDLPEAMTLSVYRIVQEALTNVIKHAGPADCRVLVDVTDNRVSIEVSDDGRLPAAAVDGHGLIGMRERVSLYNGRFAAGPCPGGGYRVRAELPLTPTGGPA